MPKLSEPKPVPTIIQDLLDEIDASDLTDKEITRKAGVSINTIYNIRHRRTVLTIPILVRLADALNCIPRLITKEPNNG